MVSGLQKGQLGSQKGQQVQKGQQAQKPDKEAKAEAQ
jgi:hypothetical protein